MIRLEIEKRKKKRKYVPYSRQTWNESRSVHRLNIYRVSHLLGLVFIVFWRKGAPLPGVQDTDRYRHSSRGHGFIFHHTHRWGAIVLLLTLHACRAIPYIGVRHQKHHPLLCNTLNISSRYAVPLFFGCNSFILQCTKFPCRDVVDLKSRWCRNLKMGNTEHRRSSCVRTWAYVRFAALFCKKFKNISCEYDRLNGWNSTFPSCVVHQTPLLGVLILCFIYNMVFVN